MVVGSGIALWCNAGCGYHYLNGGPDTHTTSESRMPEVTGVTL